MPSLIRLAVCFLLFLVGHCYAQLPSGVVDTQPNGDTPPPPEESLAKITVPEGFHVTLFAGEPDVHQPIAMEFDDRGRLWVVECFSYPDWHETGTDRVLIFEDTDNDGRFDTRKVFAAKLRNVTGMALGFGGVWLCSAPEFVFIPDRDGDDVPDGPAEVKLDGWNDNENSVKHNVFNGMKWGPDGWMYGGHGILDNSLIGKPGTPKEQRQKMNCGVWRYHPVKDKFEIVAHGTTNPWGIDFNEHGEGFFTNSVIGHFWHMIPGARYRRMYGSHFNPYTYTLMESCSDHTHWGEGRWTESRGGVGAHGEAGGGHAHVGALIYQGGRWPKKYHGTLFTANLHGNRINNDIIKRQGSGYTAEHGEDFLFGNDPWFRGIGIKCGPDGNVFVSDWTDLGECHDNDGTHRSSGRIYKISYGEEVKLPKFDLSKLPNSELITYADHPNKWYWERARRLLHERSTDGADMQDVVDYSNKRLKSPRGKQNQIRFASLLALLGEFDQYQGSTNEPMLALYLRHLSQETEITVSDVEEMCRFAKRTSYLRPRQELAIALQRIAIPRHRLLLATSLIESFPDNADHNMQAMLWYGIEPLAENLPEQFIKLASINNGNPQLAELRQFIVRRYLSDADNLAGRIDKVLSVADECKNEQAVGDILAGVAKAMDGRKLSSPPSSWAKWSRQYTNKNLDGVLTELGIIFGDERLIARLLVVAKDKRANAAKRRAAVRTLSENRVPNVLPLLLSLLDDTVVRKEAIQGLRRFNSPQVAKALVANFDEFTPVEQSAAVATLTSSQSHALALLNAVAAKSIPASAIRPTDAAKINQMRDKGIKRKLASVWGDVRSTPREAKQKIADWKAILGSKEFSQPNLVAGKKLYTENCGKCHKLFGEGGDIGPELTGADRRNLDYLLENVISPSAVVGKDYRTKSVILRDGRTVSGVVLESTPATLVVQTPDEKVTIAHDDIDTIESNNLSLMPAGQFDVLSKEQVRDLVGYLRAN